MLIKVKRTLYDRMNCRAKEKVDIRKVAYIFGVVVRAIVKKKAAHMYALPAKTILLLAFSHIFLFFLVIIKWQYGDECTSYKENIFSELLKLREPGKIQFNSIRRSIHDRGYLSGKFHSACST